MFGCHPRLGSDGRQLYLIVERIDAWPWRVSQGGNQIGHSHWHKDVPWKKGDESAR